MSLGPNKPRYTRDNVAFHTFIVYLKTQDANGNFPIEWQSTGLTSGNATIEWTQETADLKAGIPQTTVARVIKAVDATARITILETDIENLGAFLFQQTPVYTATTSTSSKTYNSVGTTDFITNPKLSPNPIYILDAIPDVTATLTVMDSSSPSQDVSTDFALKIVNGVPFVERTSATFPGTPPYTITISKYTAIKRDSLRVFENPSKIGNTYKLLMIGRNVVNKNLEAIYIPSMVLDTPPTIGFYGDDFQKLEVSFKTLAEYPNTSPLSNTFAPVYLIREVFEPTTNPEIIVARFNFEVITDMPS